MYKAMIVDDNREIRHEYSRMEMWERCGFFVVEEASNGLQALELMKQHAVDLVLTDIQMPLMDGITLMKNIHEKWPETLMVLVSASGEFEYAREGMRQGAIDYVVKPMLEKDLEDVLERAGSILAEHGYKENHHMLARVLPEGTAWKDEHFEALGACFEENLEHNLTLEEVAAVLHMNKDYLGKLIKNKTGLHFRNLYHRYKMEYAKSMLKNGHHHIYEISAMLGYTSADYFSQTFKQVVGMSPAEYKKS